MTMIDEGPLQETTSVHERGRAIEKRRREKRAVSDDHTQTRVDCEMVFWDSHPFPPTKGADEHHWFGRGNELRISRAPGRARSTTGRRGLEGVTFGDAVRVEQGSRPDGFKGGVMGDSEEPEEHESLSLHEDISFSSISSERQQFDDEVATRGASGVSTTELACRE